VKCVYYLGLRRTMKMKMEPDIKVGTILSIGKVVEIKNECVVVLRDGKRIEVTFDTARYS